ncbi:MAG TPA: 50S ribosomal protein L21 [Magnetospirillaceae bacterium]|nr:50S ribosomal protein L21 [Magnetospirillaceae bacterium]
MYAVVEVKGKQYRAETGESIRVDRMEGEKGQSVSLDAVLMVSGTTVRVGAPYVAGASVRAVIADHARADKIIVFKYKPKKDYRRKHGHRQDYTLLRIEDIVEA